MEGVKASAKERRDQSIYVTKFRTIVWIAEKEQDFLVLQVAQNAMMTVEKVKLLTKKS